MTIPSRGPRIEENPVSQTRDTREVPNTQLILTRAVFDTASAIITMNRATPTSEWPCRRIRRNMRSAVETALILTATRFEWRALWASATWARVAKR
jgi:hypothetical protein